MKKISKLPFAIFLLAVAIRIVLLLWSVPLAINGDQRRYEDWAQIAHIYSLSDTYMGHHNTTIVNNEPPGSLYIISGTYELYILIGKIIARVTHSAAGSLQFVNSYLLHLLMRLPSVLTDLGMGIIAYLLVAKEKGEKRGVLAAALIWFNPIIFYNSSVWGQMDSLNNFFFLLSLFLAFRNNYILSFVSYAISLYIKLSLLPLLPFYAAFLFFQSNKNWKVLLFGGIISLILIVLATFPISSQPLSWLLTSIPAMSKGEFQNMTVAAFNFWWVVTCGPVTCPHRLAEVSDKFLEITLSTWGYALFALVTLPIFYLQLKKPSQFIKKQYLFLALSLVAFTVFLFLPRMHDRYLYPFFPLFAIALSLCKKLKSSLLLYGVLSLVYLTNSIYSFYPTKFPAFIFYQILYSNLFRWSISALILTLGIIIYQKSMVVFLRSEKK